jgi:hypothetical protein
VGALVHRQTDEIEAVTRGYRCVPAVIAATAMTIAGLTVSASEIAQTAKTQSPGLRDGAHDFDFASGTWRTHIQSLVKTANGSQGWASMEGTKVSRPLGRGHAQWEEIEAVGSSGRLKGATLVIYNAEAHQWSQIFVSADGIMGTPLVGEFKNGVGQLIASESLNGRVVLARAIWSQITGTTYKYEAATSSDGGRTWETHFVAHLERADSR